MSVKQGLPIIEIPHRLAWEGWLEANHASSNGVWIKFAKKGSRTQTVTYPEALEEALRYGWIDGQVSAYDADFYLQRFTERRPRSKWSQNNRKKAEALIAQGRMKPAGLAHVKAAQRDGRWEHAYESQRDATVPADFQRALDRNPKAKEFFVTLGGSRRYAFLYRLHHVKSPQARVERIARYVELLSEGRTLQD